DQHVLPLTKARGRHELESSVTLGPRYPLGLEVSPRSAQRGGLRLAASLRHRLGEVREHHSEPEPDGHPEDEPPRRLTLTPEPLEPEQGRKDGSDVDDEHDR